MLFALSLPWSTPASSNEVLTLESFLDQVARQHPEVAMATFELAATDLVQQRSGLLPDPVLSLSRGRVPWILHQSTASMEGPAEAVQPAETSISFSQTYPWPGTNAQAIAATAKKRERQGLDREAEAALRLADAESLYIVMVAASQLLSIEQDNLKESDAILRTAALRLKHGIGAHHDVVQAEAENTILSLNIDAINLEVALLKDRLAQLMGKPDASGLTFDTKLQNQAQARKANKDFGKLALQVRNSELTASLASERARSMPSIMTEGMLMQDDSGMRMGSVMAGVSIPLFSGKIRSSIDQEVALKQRSLTNNLAWYDTRKAHALKLQAGKITLFENNIKSLTQKVIPSARQHLQTQTTEYAQGRGSFASVNQARRQLLRYLIALISSERDLNLARIEQQIFAMGFFPDNPSHTMPQLLGGEMGNSMDTSMSEDPGSMSPMPATARPGPRSKAPNNNRPPRSPSGPPMDDEPSKPAGGMSGM